MSATTAELHPFTLRRPPHISLDEANGPVEDDPPIEEGSPEAEPAPEAAPAVVKPAWWRSRWVLPAAGVAGLAGAGVIAAAVWVAEPSGRPVMDTRTSALTQRGQLQASTALTSPAQPVQTTTPAARGDQTPAQPVVSPAAAPLQATAAPTPTATPPAAQPPTVAPQPQPTPPPRDLTNPNLKIVASPMMPPQQVAVLDLVTQTNALVVQIRQKIEELTRENTALRAEMADLRQTVSLTVATASLRAAQSAGAPPLAAEPAPPPPAPTPTVKTATKTAACTVMPKLEIASVSPRFVTLRGGSEEMIDLGLGSTIPCYGKIMAIAQEGAKWVVKTERGAISGD